MSNILFNNIPMMEFFNGETKCLTKLPISVDDLFSLTKEEAKQFADAIIQLNEVAHEWRNMKPSIPADGNILKRRVNTLQDT